MKMVEDPVSKLILPQQFVDEKQSLKKSIDQIIEYIVNSHSNIKELYFLTFHAKFNPSDPTLFNIDSPKITKKLPPFISNSLVYWVSNARGICELLWMVPPKKKGEKLKVEFNKEGVAYLQAKGAMPS
jgi:hypothetical protein